MQTRQYTAVQLSFMQPRQSHLLILQTKQSTCYVLMQATVFITAISLLGTAAGQLAVWWCRVSDLNDNAPVFLGTPYTISIPESTPPNTTVFRNKR
jgi:hypothetical protein